METTEKRDGLEHFLRLAEECVGESRKRWGYAFEFLDRIHKVMYQLCGEISDAVPIVPLTLGLSAHAAYLGAVRAAMSGQVTPVYMTLRGAIESALYALMMIEDGTVVDIWLKRHETVESRTACKNTFTYANALASLRKHDEGFSVVVGDAYAASIDFGAHPNTKGVISHIQIGKRGDQVEVQLIYLYNPNSFEVARGLLACAETGTMVLGILATAFPKLFELRGLEDETNSLIHGTHLVMESLGLNQNDEPSWQGEISGTHNVGKS